MSNIEKKGETFYAFAIFVMHEMNVVRTFQLNLAQFIFSSILFAHLVMH